MNKQDETKLIHAHYKNPRIKKTIMNHAKGPSEIFRAGNGDFSHWYKTINKNEYSLYDLSNNKDYELLTKRFRSLYWTLNFFEPKVKSKTIPKTLKDNDGNKITIGSFKETRSYSLGVDIDGIGSITKKEVRDAVESMGQYLADQFRELCPNSVYGCFSGGGIYLYINENLFTKKFEKPENAAYSWRVLTGCFNKYIEDLQEQFYEKYPQYKPFVKADAINNQKRLFKSIFSIHKKYLFAVIPLDIENIKIDLRKARLPLDKQIIESAEKWGKNYDINEAPALITRLKEYESFLKTNYSDDKDHKIDQLTTKADFDNFPPCIKKIFSLKNVGAGATRMKTLIAVFLGQAGFELEEAEKLFNEVSNKLGGPRTNIFESWFNKMSCPLCKTIQEKGAGFPFLNMGNLDICEPNDYCRSIKSPFHYIKQKTPSTPSTTSTPSTPSTPSTFSEKNHLVSALLMKKRQPFQSIGRGLHNGVFYIGTSLDHQGKQLDAVVTSDRKIYVDWGKDGINEIKELFGLNYRFPLFADCMDHWWTRESIHKFYGNGYKVDIKTLFKEIVKINKKYMIYEDSRIHYYTALDIIRSFFFPLFPANNRTFHHADKDSGKTNQLMIYRALSFNPISSTDFSSASIYRIIESTGGTILIDDFDNIPEDQKLAIIQHIRTNYKPFKTIRADGNKRNRPYAYKSYSHLIFNNTMGLGYDEITPTRCITIRLLRHKDAKDITVNDNDPIFESLRNDLYVMALQYFNEIKESYDNLKLPDFSTRQLEVIKPVLAIAHYINKDIFNDLVGWYKEYLETEKLKDLHNDWEFHLLRELWEKVQDRKNSTEQITVKVKDVSQSLAGLLLDEDSKDYKKQLNRLCSFVGGRIKSYIIFKGGHSNGLTYYNLYKEGVEKILESHDLTPEDFKENKENEKVEGVEGVEGRTPKRGMNITTFDNEKSTEGQRENKKIDLTRHKMTIKRIEEVLGSEPINIYSIGQRMNKTGGENIQFIEGLIHAAINDNDFSTIIKRDDKGFYFKEVV